MPEAAAGRKRQMNGFTAAPSCIVPFAAVRTSANAIFTASSERPQWSRRPSHEFILCLKTGDFFALPAFPRNRNRGRSRKAATR
jgi:hypothetical protein